MRLIAISMLIAGLWLGGCASGHRYNFQAATPTLSAADTIPVALAVQDQRSYVLSGEKLPKFVGTQRGVLGMPFAITTESGAPLADEVSKAVSRALSEKGYKVTTVEAMPKEEEHAVLTKLTATKAKRLLLLSVREWKSDSYKNSTLFYDLTLNVMDSDGKPLGKKSIAGKDELQVYTCCSPEHAGRVIVSMFEKKIAELFNSKEIEGALH